MNKPRIYWCYYPKLKRGFWRLRPTVRMNHAEYQARLAAHKVVIHMNLVEEGRLNDAAQRRQAT